MLMFKIINAITYADPCAFILRIVARLIHAGEREREILIACESDE